MSALHLVVALTTINATASGAMALTLWKACRRRRPTILRGTSAIARRVGLTTRQTDALLRAGQLPTFRAPGDSAPHATTSALDDWRRIWAGQVSPTASPIA